MGRAKSYLFRILLVAIPLVVIELLAALYLNYFASNPRSLAERIVPSHVYDAYRTHALGPGWSGKHNKAGFRRSTEVSVEKPRDVFRVFLMGGSAAYGLGSPPPFPPVSIANDQTIDAQLEAMLRQETGRPVEVINAAVTAYWTHHHLIQLHQRLLDYQPDLVVLLDGINDYYHTLEDHRQFESYRYGLPLRIDGLNSPSLMTLARDVSGWAKRRSNAAFIADALADRVLGWSVAPEDPCNLEQLRQGDLNDDYRRRYERISRRTWVRTLRAVLLSLNDNGVRVITTLQPELVFEQTRGRSEGDAALLSIELQVRPALYRDKKEFLKPIARSLAEQAARGLGAPFVDLTDVFDADDQYFIDYCHLSEAGGRRVASTLFPYVRRVMERTEGPFEPPEAPLVPSPAEKSPGP